MAKLKGSTQIYFGNTYTGEIEKIECKETHSVRGGSIMETKKGWFICTEGQTTCHFGDQIFSASKAELLSIMEEFKWGMTEKALKMFKLCKKEIR